MQRSVILLLMLAVACSSGGGSGSAVHPTSWSAHLDFVVVPESGEATHWAKCDDGTVQSDMSKDARLLGLSCPDGHRLDIGWIEKDGFPVLSLVNASPDNVLWYSAPDWSASDGCRGLQGQKALNPSAGGQRAGWIDKATGRIESAIRPDHSRPELMTAMLWRGKPTCGSVSIAVEYLPSHP